MIFISRQEPFTCEHCGFAVEPLEHGTCRNHCRKCLWSKHVDDQGPGDRASLCQGLMPPTGMEYDGKRGWTIVHVCEKCGKKIINKTAPDDDMSKIQNSPI